MHRRKRLRPPVLGRLAWAWLCAFAVLAGGAGYFINASQSGEGAQRIALPVDKLERFARAPEPRSGGEERIAAPAVKIGLGGPDRATEMMDGEEGEDSLTLIYPGESEIFEEREGVFMEGEDDADDYAGDVSGDIVITIPGARNKAAVAHAASLTPPVRAIPDPDDALLRATALGETPRIAPDGRKSVAYYARPFEGDRASPRIAILVGGLGLNAAVTERAIDDLPPEVSLSFAPYAKNLDFWTRKARQAGHEVLIELPMEGYGANVEALGAAALLTSRSPEENLQRLDWLMSRFGAYFAATNYLGAKFSADEAAMAPVLARLKEAGVGYIDDTGAAKRAGAQSGLAMATVARMIPAAADDEDLRAVKRELAALEEAAKRDGMALGKTYAYAATIDEIVIWAKTLEEKGIEPAPASALLRTAAATR